MSPTQSGPEGLATPGFGAAGASGLAISHEPVVTAGEMMTLPVVAFAYATTFRLKELAAMLTELDKNPEIVLDKDCLVVRLSSAPWVSATTPGSGHAAPGHAAPGPLAGRLRLAVLFDFGAVVLIGMDASERDRIIRTISAKLGPEPHPPLTEDFIVEVRPGAQIAVQFDRVILPDATLPALKLICLLLAQSAAMDYYDEDVQEIQRRSDTITKSLQLEGRLPGRGGDLLKFIGSCIATKNGVIATLSLFDKPDATWEDPQLDRLYNGLRLELEIDDRFRSLEAKLRMIQENLVLLVDLTHSRSTWRLELTVVILILLEVFLTLWQMFHSGGHS